LGWYVSRLRNNRFRTVVDGSSGLNLSIVYVNEWRAIEITQFV
jgi:hypothetical protein